MYLIRPFKGKTYTLVQVIQTNTIKQKGGVKGFSDTDISLAMLTLKGLYVLCVGGVKGLSTLMLTTDDGAKGLHRIGVDAFQLKRNSTEIQYRKSENEGGTNEYRGFIKMLKFLKREVVSLAMRTYTIKRQDHYVYESLDELPKDLVYLKDWRKAEIGDWVLADDGCIIQVLRKNSMAQKKGKTRVSYTLGTCTGTFFNKANISMDTEKRDNVYNLSGKNPKDSLKDRDEITSNESLFAHHLTKGLSPEDAYIKSFRTNNKKYAKIQAGILVKTSRIRKAMKEELKPVLVALGIEPELVLSGIRDIATDPEAKHSDKLKALFELGEILELKETNKVTEVTGALFQGFQPEQIQSTQRPQLKE